MNVTFIKYLAEKLKTGNLRSIHLNALPSRYLTRLDVTKLNDLIGLRNASKSPVDLSDVFVFEHLLQKEHFKFLINFKGINAKALVEEDRKKLTFIARRLNALFNQDEDNYLEHGTRTFGFGYPFLIKKSNKDPKRIIKAPIFIWSLDIKRSKSVPNEWMITKTPDAPIYINEVLISHINKDENITIDRLQPEYLEDNKIDKFELGELAAEILSYFRTTKDSLRPKIEPCLDATTIQSRITNPYIMWSGVFGLFKTQKQSIIKDIDQLAKQFDEQNIKVAPFEISKNTAVSTDPSQQEIIHSIDKTECKIIQGPPGTGKSQSITAIITNALENHRKILVVCEKKTALEVIENNLHEIGLGQVCTTIDDINRDRKQVIDRVRYIEKNGLGCLPSFSETEYLNALHQFEQLTTGFNQKHQNLLKSVLNDKNTQHIITEYLNLRQQGFDLKHLLDRIDLALTGEEYGHLNRVVREAMDLYEEVDSRYLPLDGFLPTRFLETYSLPTEKAFFKDILLVEDLTRRFIQHWDELTFKETEIAENYLKSHRRWTKVKAIFSKSNKMVAKHWAATFALFQQLKAVLEESKLLSLKNNWTEESENLTAIREEIREMQWFSGESSIMKFKFRPYYLWRHFYEQQPLPFQEVLDNLRSFVPNIQDWLPILKLEYLNVFLEKRELEIGPFNENTHQLTKILKLQNQLRRQQKDKILKHWHIQQGNAIKAYNRRSNIKWLFNYRKNNKYSRRNSLRNIIQEEFDLFTTMFPVILVNPVVCSSIMPLKKGIFDIVIFDEASQLRLEDTFAAFYRGKIKVISGDKQQMPPSSYFASDILLDLDEDIGEEGTSPSIHQSISLADSESLLDFGNQLNPAMTNISYLDFHYRSKHPHLIDFSNAAFYGKRLVPMPATGIYQPIHFISVNGNYRESQNYEEAQQVIDIIKNEIHPFQDGSYPTLGIATFNLKQRNLIKNLIYSQIISDKEFGIKMKAIEEEANWFVKNLENIQGDERDIIIISTTFGINGKGKFIQNFGPINNLNRGYKLLNVIITRAKRQVFILTSIPEKYYTSEYQNEIQQRGNKGKGIFYAYLDYCRSVSNGNEKKRQTILNLLANHAEGLLHYAPHHEKEVLSFSKIVYNYLLEYIDKKYIEYQFSFGGYTIDIVIKNEKQIPQIAIECDGTDWHNTSEAYVYDIHRQKIIKNHGLEYRRIWSKNWWKHPDKTAILLVNEIIEKMPFVLKGGILE